MIDIRIKAISRLGDGDVSELNALHSRFFENSGEVSFRADFAEKDFVITVRDDGGYKAFSTIKLIDENMDGTPKSFLFSGDTIVHPDYWSRNLLAPAFGAFLSRMMIRYEGRELYWFLISKGFRTYMFLPTFFKTFYPSPDLPPDKEYVRLLNLVAGDRYGAAYDREMGVISFGGARDYLCEELRQVPEAKAAGRHVSFFLERNPGYARGNELACITRIDRENIKPLGLRLLEFKALRWDI